MQQFLATLLDYLIEILPVLAAGFFLSGLINEFVPARLIERHLGRSGPGAVLLASLVGVVLPICCWGSLPLAVTLHKKGSRIGPVLAFLVATPATSATAFLVSLRLLGWKFAAFEFFAVILMGLLVGLAGNRFPVRGSGDVFEPCPDCDNPHPHSHNRRASERVRSVLRFAFLEMPREIGPETLVGMLLAAFVVSFAPLGAWIRSNLAGGAGYGFSLVFSLLMYICATATVPLVDALIRQGLSAGAGMVLLLIGPVTSYGTILVLRKRFGTRLLLAYLTAVSLAGLGLGLLFSLL